MTGAAQRSGLGWSAQGVHRALAANPFGLRRVASDLLDSQPASQAQRLLIPIDQSEELFTRSSPAGREHFAALLRNAAGPAQLVLTLRSEFLDDLRDLPSLEGVPIDAFVLPPLGRDMLPDVIEGPARIAGLRLEPELVPRLVHDTGTGDALPLLAFTLHQLSDGLDRGGTLTLARYATLGGVQGALSRHADAALAAAVARTGLPEQEVLAGLVRLVTIDGAGRWSRREVRVDSLPERIQAALLVLVDRRLLVVDSTQDGAGILSVAHEALLTAWRPLRTVIGERLVALQAARTVEQAAADWHRDGRPENYLWDEKRLAGALVNLGWPGDADAITPTDPMVHLNEEAMSFLEASRLRIQAVRVRESRRRRSLVAVLSTLMVLALTAAVLAVWQRQEALDGQRSAVARTVLAQADVARDRDPRSALQLAGAAHTLDPSTAAQASLIQTLASAPSLNRTLTGFTAGLSSLALSADGNSLATGAEDGTVVLWDITDSEQPGRVGGPISGSGPIVELALTPDARILATANGDEASITTLWDITDREHPRALGPPLNLEEGSVMDLSFSPDGRTLAITINDNTVRLWDVANPERPQPLGQPIADPTAPSDEPAPNMVFGRFSPDGDTLVVTTNTAMLWDITDRENPRELGRTSVDEEGSPVITAFSIAPDGRTLATSGSSGVELWDVTNPKRPRAFTTPTALQNVQVEQLAFAADGRSLAVAGDFVTLWDLGPDGPQPRGQPLFGHTSDVTSMAFTPDGRALVTTSSDKSAILWNLTATDLAPQIGQPLDAGQAVFSPDRHIMATAQPDNTVFLWDIVDPATPRRVGERLANHSDYVFYLAFSADGKTLATGSRDNTVALWDLVDPEQPRALGQPIRVGPPLPPFTIGPETLDSVALSPDGTTLATAQQLGVTLWDLSDREAPRPIGSPFGTGSFDLSFSADGIRLATGDSVWDLTDRAQPRPLVQGIGGEILPNGLTLATVDNKGVTLWDLADPGAPRALGQPFGAPVDEMTLSGDGSKLATSSYETGSAVLWDLTDQTRPRPLGQPLSATGGVSSISFSPNGRTIAVSGSDSTVVLRDLTRLSEFRRDPLGQACSRAGGPLDPTLWSNYAPGFDYQNTCQN